MIYCPKCKRVANEIICPHCGSDIVCCSEQMYKNHKDDIDTLRSNHDKIPDLIENQEYMNDILRKEMY